MLPEFISPLFPDEYIPIFFIEFAPLLSILPVLCNLAFVTDIPVLFVPNFILAVFLTISLIFSA